MGAVAAEVCSANVVSAIAGFCAWSSMLFENYSSVIPVHPVGRPRTLVIESFVIDVPEGSTKDETCYFVEAVIKCNLKLLSDVSERLAVQDRG